MRTKPVRIIFVLNTFAAEIPGNGTGMAVGPTAMTDTGTGRGIIINLKKERTKIMIKMRKIIIRVLKCLICFLTGGYSNKKNGGNNEAC